MSELNLVNIYYNKFRYIFFNFKLYVANNIISIIPSHKIRLLYYKYIIHLKIGRNTSIHLGARITGIGNIKIKIGDNCAIGHNVWLDGRDELTIGNNVSIGGPSIILTGEHDPDDLHFNYRSQPVKIADNVWIATNSLIIPGVTVGEGAVIAAGSVVTKDVLPYQIVGGAPAKFIRNRNKNLKYKLNYALIFH